MNKQITQFKTIIQEIECLFHFDSTCPTHIAKEALLECLKWIGKIEDKAKESGVDIAPEQPPADPEPSLEPLNEETA